MTRNELGNPEVHGVPDGSDSASRRAAETSRTSGDSHARAEQGSRLDARRDRQRADHVPAETLTREDYGDRIRAEGAPIPATDGFHRDSSRAVEGASPASNRGGSAVVADHADPRDRETYTDQIRAGHDPVPADRGEPAGVPGSTADTGSGQITHYYGEFQDQQVDLYTDGSRWAPGDRASETIPGADPVTASDPAEISPGTVYLQGKEVEVSGIAADGIWVGGLPGEMPGTPHGDPYGTAKVGDVLAGTDITEKSLAEGLGDIFAERAEDILDATEKDLNSTQQIFGPGPTHSETAVPSAHGGADRPYHKIDAGNAASALLVLGFVVWGIHRIWEQWKDQRRDRETHLDGGN